MANETNDSEQPAQSTEQKPEITYIEPYDSWRCWLPGLRLSIIIGIGSFASIALIGDLGLALFVGVPSAMGAILGYRVRTTVIWLVMLSLISISAVVFGLIALDVSGLFCGFTLGVIFVIPFAVGLVLGVLLRFYLKQSGWRQRHYLPTLLLALLPLGEMGIECLFDYPDELHTVQTSLTFHATKNEAWESLMFYEEVNVEPPWLLQLALPRPIKAEGEMGQVGEVRRCLYENGHLSKRITKRVEQQELAFVVIEQKLHFEKDVTLKDGRFVLHKINENETEVVLTTRYIRHLHPAWLWKPIEEEVVHTLHQHVLEGMRKNCKQQPTSPPSNYEPVKPTTLVHIENF